MESSRRASTGLAGPKDAAEPSRLTAIVNVTLYDGTGAPAMPGATVTTLGDRIESVIPGGHSAPPLTGDVIDGTGMTLLPGLIDMHTHLLWPDTLPRFLAHGVTTVRDVGNELEVIARHADQERAGLLKSPRIFFCGPALEGDPPFFPSSIQIVLSDTSEAAPAVDRLADAGACAIKLYMGVRAELMSAVIAHASRRHLRVTAHLGRVSASTAVGLGLNGVEHVAQGLYADLVAPQARLDADERTRRGLARFWAEFMAGWATVEPDGPASRRVIEIMTERDIYLVPTLGTQECKSLSAADEQLETSAFPGIPQTMRAAWVEHHATMTGGWDPHVRTTARRAVAQMQGFVAEFHRAGGQIVTGSDVGAPYMVPGASVHRELELLVESGISARDALHSATGAAARALGRERDLGTVEPGKLADMVLVDGEPYENIRDVRRITKVFKGGDLVHEAKEV